MILEPILENTPLIDSKSLFRLIKIKSALRCFVSMDENATKYRRESKQLGLFPISKGRICPGWGGGAEEGKFT